MAPTAASTALPAPTAAAAMTCSEPTGLERALRIALANSSSGDSDGSMSVLQAICADTALMRDAQLLFAQLVPRTSPSSLSPSTSAANVSIGAFRGSAMPPQSPFSTAFDRSMRLMQPNPLNAAAVHEKMSALVAVVATGISRELEQERRDDEAEAEAEDVDMQHETDSVVAGSTKRKREESPLSAAAFLRHFTSLFDRLLLDPELLEVATTLKEEFTVATVLFEKYRTLWRKLVPPVASSHVHEPTASAASATQQQRTPPRRKMSDGLLEQLVSVDRHELLHDAGWLLFLVAKRRLSAHYTGLGPLYYLLLAVLHVVLSNVSAPTIEAEVAAALSALGASASDGGEAPSNSAKLLDALCANPKVDTHEVTRAAADLDAVLLQLRSERDVLVLHTAAVADADPASTTADAVANAYARAVLHESVIADNVARLSAHYRCEYLDGCGKLDERFYLDTFAHQVVMGPKPLPPPASSSSSSHGSSALSSPGLVKRSARADRLVPPLTPFASPSRTPQRLGNASVRSSATPLSVHPLTSSSSSSASGPPASPFTRQAWQFNGASPPPASSTFSSARASTHTPNTRAFLHTATTHDASPHIAQTPVTAAVETSNWIRDTLAHTSGFVTPQLKRFFRDCASDPSDHIARVLHDLAARLLATRRRTTLGASVTGAPSLDEGLGLQSAVDSSLQQTKNLAIALFYRVLEALLASERERLRTTNFSALLHNESFVASLFACSLEVVLKAHGLITLAFPFLLDTVGVNAFDFGKIIESFVKHVPALPHALKRHMRDLEQSILDSLAWRADSGLYVILAGGTSTSTTLPTTSSTATTSDALLAALTNGAPSASLSTTTVSSTRTSVLQLFFRKVLSLAASRIFRLGTILELDAKYLNQVWTAIKECISSHHALLKDRHLDHVILCSLYGVCKVNLVRPEVTFKRVIDAYKKLHSQQQQQQHATGLSSAGSTPSSALGRTSTSSSNDVIRNIKLDDSGARGDIIKFYNRCYIPTMKVFMLQFQIQDKQMAAADAVVASAVVAPTSGSATAQAPPGFTPRREGSVVAASTSDTEIVAEAAADAVAKVMQSYGLAPSGNASTPHRGVRCGFRSIASASPRLAGSPLASSLQLFTTAEVQSLPVSVHQTSPKRVHASNIYMSPLQQARLHHRSHLTPRSHALYAFGESPSRDLALINRAVNTNMARTRVAAPRPPLVLPEMHDDDDDDEVETSESNSNSAASTPTNSLKRRHA